MRTRAFGLFVALIAAVTLVSVTGAATANVPTAGLRSEATIDVSTRASVVRYLRSIHVNPRGVVIQRGARNYAGADCPGKGWSCTSTTHPVVQIASSGGWNSFDCSTGHCAVVQVSVSAPTATAVTNTAKCVKTGYVSSQTCSIIQSNSKANNLAIVFESIKPSSMLTTATSTATIKQTATGASNGNTACVTQNIKLVRSGTGTTSFKASLNAHQTVKITQDATGSGANSAQYGAKSTGVCDFANPLAQNQTLLSTVKTTRALTQNENATDSGANVTIDIEQNQGGAGFGVADGTNNATFVQKNTLTAIANSSHGPINQTQSSPDGGLLGTINQDSTGVSTADVTQIEIQCEDAAKTGLTHCDTNDLDASEAPAALTQTQFGPVRKGVGTSTQSGNGNDTFHVSQSSTQNNDTGDGQTNLVQGDCSTSGNCTVTQHTTVDGELHTNMRSGQNVNTHTTCVGNQCTSGGAQLIELSMSNTDVREFGVGDMRGTGTGSIDVTGITGPVTQAFLYWNGPSNSSDPSANASVMFQGKAITGTELGTSGPLCWPSFTNSQSYRAGVTSLVKGNGTYSLSRFLKLGPNETTVADVNGVALFVFYNDGNSANNRNVVLWNGNDSNDAFGNDLDGWDKTLTGVPYPGSGSASLDFVVSDGQSYQDGAIAVNGTTIVSSGGIFQGATGQLWDVKSFALPSGLLTTGSNTLEVTSPAAADCLSLVVVAANMPSG